MTCIRSAGAAQLSENKEPGLDQLSPPLFDLELAQ